MKKTNLVIIGMLYGYPVYIDKSVSEKAEAHLTWQQKKVEELNEIKSNQEFMDYIKKSTCSKSECQDEIQEDTTSMEEKLEALDELSACCGAWYTDARFCSACHEHC